MLCTPSPDTFPRSGVAAGAASHFLVAGCGQTLTTTPTAKGVMPPQERTECPVQGTRAAIWPGRSLRRWIYALLGVISVGVGFIGVFVPGLPTTIFLILASYLFTRSCPWLEEKLVRAPIFKPYLRYVDGERAMPLRARIVTIAMIWTATTASCVLLAARGALRAWFVIVIGLAALTGSIVVATSFRGASADGSEAP